MGCQVFSRYVASCSKPMVPCTPHGTPQPAPVHQPFLAVIFVSQGPGWPSCSIPLKKKTPREGLCVSAGTGLCSRLYLLLFAHTSNAEQHRNAQVLPVLLPWVLSCTIGAAQPPSSLFTLQKTAAPASPAPLGAGMPVPSSRGVRERLEAGGFQLCQSYSARQLSVGRKVILHPALVP